MNVIGSAVCEPVPLKIIKLVKLQLKFVLPLPGAGKLLIDAINNNEVFLFPQNRT